MTALLVVRHDQNWAGALLFLGLLVVVIVIAHLERR